MFHFNRCYSVSQSCETFTYYTQHVLSPTRNDTILDLILSSDPDLVSDVLVLHNLGNSDHNMVSFTVHSEYETFHSIRQVRDYCKGDYDGIREQLSHLSDIDWDSYVWGHGI